MYRFGVDADTSSAEQKLNRIKELMDEIDRLNSKTGDNYFYSSQKDIDRNVKSMQEIIKLQKDLERQMSALKSTMAEMGDIGGIRSIDAGLNSLNKTLDSTKSKFKETADSRQNMSGHDRNLIKDQERFNMELSDEIQKLKEIKDLNREIRGTQRRVSNRAQNFSSAGRMTANQERVLKGDMEALRGSEGLRERNEQRIHGANNQMDTIDNQLRELAKNTSMNNQERRNEEANLKRLRKATEEYIKALQEANTTIKQSAEVREQAQNRLEGTTVDADPNTMMGQIASRAPSIAIASLGAMAGVFGSLYAKGGTANSAMREPTISIGQRTGQSDFRSVRKQAQEMGLEKGINYKGMDMLDFQETVLGAQGFDSVEALSDSTKVMAEGARAIPVGKDELNKFMEGAMRDGSISGSEQIKAMQEAFLGAIEQSGMVGREKEQLDALNSLNQQLFAGRNGNQEELNNLVALQGMLSDKGGRSMQGEKGAQALSSLDAGLKGAVNDPITKLIFGRGTKYQGLSGDWELTKQLEKGISDPENLKTLFNFSESQAGGVNADISSKKAAFRRTAVERLGADLTSDQVDGLYKATNNGADLSDETLKKAYEKYGIEGGEKRDKNAKDYKDSKEGLADRSEAVTEKQASYLNDMGDLFKKVNSAMGGLPSLLYAFAGGLVASIGALALSAGMGGISSVIKNVTKGTFGGGASTAMAGGAGAGGFLKNVGSMFKSGKASGGFFGGAKQAGGFIKDSAMFKGSEIAGKAKGLFQGGASTASAVGESAGVAGKAGSMASKGMGFLGKAGGVLGKVAPWLAVGGAVADVATSDDKVKATGKNAGMLGGMALGAKGGAIAGATIGSAVPVVGTAVGGAIGGLVGSVGGAFAGSKLGSGVVDAGRGAIDWGKDKLSGITGAIKDGFSWGKDKVVDGIKGAFSLGKDFFSKGMDILKTPDRLLKKGASKLWDIGKGAVGKVGNFFGGETAEASEIQQSGLSAGAEKSKKKKAVDKKEKQGKNSEEKDTTDKKLEAEKAREKNVMNEGANLSFYSTLLDRAKQLLAEARAQNGIFGNGDGSGDGSGSSGGGSLSYLGDGEKWTDKDITKHDLGKTVMGITAKELDAWIDEVAPANSSMRGLGATFIEAGEKSGLDPRYLVAHSAVETGWGTSNLSKGGDPNKGNWFGIGAFDDNPNNGFNYGNGIVGGAQWIADNFYKNGQTTLDKMRHNGGQHEYATDPNWDKTIASIMKGSEQYTKGKAQTFSTNNSVNVTVNTTGDAKGARAVGRQVGDAVTNGLNDSVNFYAKELRRV